MNLSDTLASLNVERYAAWRPRFTARNSKPALFAFNGDVYEGLDANSLDADALEWAQQHVVILSGLYGALRPLDRLQAYRLEMGIRLPTARGRDLYAFWGQTLSGYLRSRLGADAAPVVVNLASQEYFRTSAPSTASTWACAWSSVCSKTGTAGASESSASTPSGRVASWCATQCSSARSARRRCKTLRWRVMLLTALPANPTAWCFGDAPQ